MLFAVPVLHVCCSASHASSPTCLRASCARPQAARLSVMGLLAHLEHTLGRCVAASALESMAIAVK